MAHDPRFTWLELISFMLRGAIFVSPRKTAAASMLGEANQNSLRMRFKEYWILAIRIPGELCAAVQNP